MTHEQAMYYKYLLICGFTEELNNYIDTALNRENPISDIVLNLSSCRSDNKKTLMYLNEFISTANEEQIDYNEVFNLIHNFLRNKYTLEKATVEKITDLMYKISVLSEKEADNPWWTMNILGDLYAEAKDGYIDMQRYMENFNSFINDGICMESSILQEPKPSFFKRLFKKANNK